MISRTSLKVKVIGQRPKVKNVKFQIFSLLSEKVVQGQGHGGHGHKGQSQRSYVKFKKVKVKITKVKNHPTLVVALPGRPGVATFLPLNYHWSTLLNMEVVRSVAPILHFFML